MSAEVDRFLAGLGQRLLLVAEHRYNEMYPHLKSKSTSGQFPTRADLEAEGVAENGWVVLSQQGDDLDDLGLHAPSSVTWTGPKAKMMRRIAAS